MLFTGTVEDRQEQQLMAELEIPVDRKQQEFARFYGASHTKRLNFALEALRG